LDLSLPPIQGVCQDEEFNVNSKSQDAKEPDVRKLTNKDTQQ
jgi:hypothetical protein